MANATASTNDIAAPWAVAVGFAATASGGVADFESGDHKPEERIGLVRTPERRR
jgi:hypothetical protein